MRSNFFLLLFILIVSVVTGQGRTPKLKITNKVFPNKIISLTKPIEVTEIEYKNLINLLLPLTISNLPDSIQNNENLNEDNYLWGNYDKKNTFKLTLNNKDSIYFLIDIRSSQIKPYLFLKNDTLYRLPTFPEVCCNIEEINAVAFTDINSDSYTDIIIIAQFYTGAGDIDIRYLPHYYYEIYFGSKNGFFTEENLFYKLQLNTEEPISISDVKKAYKSRKN